MNSERNAGKSHQFDAVSGSGTEEPDAVLTVWIVVRPIGTADVTGRSGNYVLTATWKQIDVTN